MRPGVTVVITSIPPRFGYLQEALKSVLDQSRQPDAVVVSIDHDKSGAAINRNNGLAMVQTEWTAFLDDDDLLMADHLAGLLDIATEKGADLAYPWFKVWPGVGDPLAVPVDGELREVLGVEFGDEQREHLRCCANFIPITYLVRTEMAQGVGGFPVPGSDEWPHDANEDWGFLHRLLEVDAKIVHHPQRTWRWRAHPGQTSGMPSRW